MATPVSFTLNINHLPAGVTLSVRYASGWPARPTTRTDIVVHWHGGTSATPPAGALPGDLWIKDPA